MCFDEEILEAFLADFDSPRVHPLDQPPIVKWTKTIASHRVGMTASLTSAVSSASHLYMQH